MFKRAVVARALRRAAVWCAVVVVLAAITGFCYESVARQGDPPAPGRLVDVGGHRLHVHCTGSGAPTVVLEAGLAESSASWDVIDQ
ncbi:hypothetical protein [Nonomuraea sp. NPDC049784]|uniref:alpha/beta fold hydrolase n=1 Tax=Nonomuraea sp. NPDC049784 TaxID=3154361 RepID=UPI0033D15ECD